MWGGRALSIDVSQKGGMPRTGKSAAEEAEVCRVQGGKSCREGVQQLLEVEGIRSKEEAKRVEREVKGTGKSSEAHNMTSKRSMDEDWNGKD